MLTQHNLSKHTERHHQLNEKRDFVEEYLDSLDLSALKGPSKVRCHGSLSVGQEPSLAEASPQPIPPQHPSQQQLPQQPQQPHQQNKAKRRGTRSKPEQHSADEVVAAKPHSRKAQESKSALIEGTKRRDSLLTAGQDETKSSKRRRQYVEAVEIEVQNLDINDSNSSKAPLKKRGGRPVRASIKTRSRTSAKLARTRRSREDLLELQPHNGERKTTSSKKPLRSRSEKNNQIGCGYRYARHHHRRPSCGQRRDHQRRDHQRNDLKELSASRGKSGRSDSNKPRKILTQGSLIINFTSPNVSRERITIAEKTGRPGIFSKGIASQRTTVHAGHDFSEKDFLNPPETSGLHRLDDQTRSKVVTSAYFTPAQDTRMDRDSTSDRSKAHSTTGSSSDSHSYSDHPRHSLPAHRGRGRLPHHHRHCHRQCPKEVSLKGSSQKSHSRMSLSDKLSEIVSLAELNSHQPWLSSLPEGLSAIPGSEVLTEQAEMIPPTVELTQHIDQTSYYPEAETTTPHWYEQNFEQASAYNGLQHPMAAAQDPYGPIYYEHGSLGSMFYQPQQGPVMEMAAQWPIQGAGPLTLSQQSSEPFVELAANIDDDALDYPARLYALSAQSSAPSQPRFRWRPHRLY
ncbi:unnamed protein product [Mortierella alpina]